MKPWTTTSRRLHWPFRRRMLTGSQSVSLPLSTAQRIVTLFGSSSKWKLIDMPYFRVVLTFDDIYASDADSAMDVAWARMKSRNNPNSDLKFKAVIGLLSAKSREKVFRVHVGDVVRFTLKGGPAKGKSFVGRVARVSERLTGTRDYYDAKGNHIGMETGFPGLEPYDVEVD